MQLRYNFRLYPTTGQRQALARAFGCARVVFNDALAARQDAHAKGLPWIKDGDLLKRVTISTRPGTSWPKDAKWPPGWRTLKTPVEGKALAVLMATSAS